MHTPFSDILSKNRDVRLLVWKKLSSPYTRCVFTAIPLCPCPVRQCNICHPAQSEKQRRRPSSNSPNEVKNGEIGRNKKLLRIPLPSSDSNDEDKFLKIGVPSQAIQVHLNEKIALKNTIIAPFLRSVVAALALASMPRSRFSETGARHTNG